MSELSTGDYSFEILDKATAANQGKATLDVNSKLINGVSGMGTVATPDAELASGKYSIKITGATDATHTSYTITNLTDSTWNTTGSLTVTDADISAGALVDGAGDTLGLNLTFLTDPADLLVGQTMSFEYIKSGQAKVELNDASGQAVQIAQNAAGTLSGTFAYTDAGAVYQSGRGVSMKLDAFANVSVATGVMSFTYEQADNFSVDVSTAAKSGQYMTKVNYAMDKVNGALSDLGSLTARLTFKEEAVTAAQVNVEAAYNRIMNANMAEEQMNASKYMILQQTAIAMLAQANQAPQNLLSLFR
jgi:flagellin